VQLTFHIYLSILYKKRNYKNKKKKKKKKFKSKSKFRFLKKLENEPFYDRKSWKIQCLGSSSYLSNHFNKYYNFNIERK